jgi:Holliday junction resolvase
VSSPSKRKGSAWETDLRTYLIDCGFDTVRNTTNGANDIGDLAVRVNGRHYVIEAKATKTLDLSGFLAEAEVEQQNYAALNRLDPGLVHPLVVVKRRNHGVSRAYVVQELGEWLRDHA